MYRCPSFLREPQVCYYYCIEPICVYHMLPSGKRLHNELEHHHFSVGKSTISMAIFNSYVKLPEGISIKSPLNPIKTH